MQQSVRKVILFFLKCLTFPVFLPKRRLKKKDAVNISIIWKNKINKQNPNDPTLDKTSNM